MNGFVFLRIILVSNNNSCHVFEFSWFAAASFCAGSHVDHIGAIRKFSSLQLQPTLLLFF